MDHIKKLKSKDIKVLLYYYFGSEKLKVSPKKVELVEAVTELFINEKSIVRKLNAPCNLSGYPVIKPHLLEEF